MMVLIRHSFNEGPPTINLEGLKYGYLPVQRYALVRVANKFGKGFADRILCLRPDWIPTKLCKSIRIKKPRDFRDEDSFI